MAFPILTLIQELAPVLTLGLGTFIASRIHKQTDLQRAQTIRTIVDTFVTSFLASTPNPTGTMSYATLVAKLVKDILDAAVPTGNAAVIQKEVQAALARNGVKAA